MDYPGVCAYANIHWPVSESSRDKELNHDKPTIYFQRKCNAVHCAMNQTANQRKLKRGHIWNEIQYGQSMPLVSLSNLHSELFLTRAEDTDSLCLHSEP